MQRLYVMVTVTKGGQVNEAKAVDTDSPRTRMGESLLMPCFLNLPGQDFGKLESLPISGGERQLINAVFVAFAAAAEVGLTPEQRHRIHQLAPTLKLAE